MSLDPTHADCIACRDPARGGLGLRCDPQPDGSVVGRFTCDEFYRGYPDRLHGGVVALLLDAAMTNCLLARGVHGVTVKMHIRYRRLVRLGDEATVRAWVRDERPPLYVVCAELRQGEAVCARAEGRFYWTPSPPATGPR